MENMQARSSILLVCLASLLFSSCGGDGPSGPGGSDGFAVTLTVSNLEHLESGEGQFELWISFPEDDGSLAKRRSEIFHEDEAFISFGRFNISPSGQIIDSQGQPMVFKPDPNEDFDINLTVDAIITIETEEKVEPGSRIMGGVFTGTDRVAVATLKLEDEDAFGFDFSSTSANYILATPTTTSSSDFNSGVWWVTPGGKSSGTTGFGAVSTGFANLPVLADTSGWMYEGWLIDNSSASAPVHYSTGKFRSGDGVDSDLAGETAGTEGAGFTFPGQDFIRAVGNIPGVLQLDNGNYELRITLEPDPDNSPHPFPLQIMTDDIIGPNISDSQTVQAMQNLAQGFPTATVRIER